MTALIETPAPATPEAAPVAADNPRSSDPVGGVDGGQVSTPETPTAVDPIEVEIVESVTVAEANETAALIRQGMVAYAGTLTLVGLAYQRRDWAVLGYESWTEYVDAEFSEARVRLTGERRRDAVNALRLYGMSSRAIGTALGVDHTTVARDLQSGVANATPGEVKGTDGKSYASTQPARTPQVPARGSAPVTAGHDGIRGPASDVDGGEATFDPRTPPAVAPAPDDTVAAGRRFIDQVAGESPEIADAELRRRIFARVEAFYAGLANLDAGRVAEVADHDMLNQLGRAHERLGQLITDVHAAMRRHGLRAV